MLRFIITWFACVKSSVLKNRHRRLICQPAWHYFAWSIDRICVVHNGTYPYIIEAYSGPSPHALAKRKNPIPNKKN